MVEPLVWTSFYEIKLIFNNYKCFSFQQEGHLSTVPESNVGFPRHDYLENSRISIQDFTAITHFAEDMTTDLINTVYEDIANPNTEEIQHGFEADMGDDTEKQSVDDFAGIYNIYFSGLNTFLNSKKGHII